VRRRKHLFEQKADSTSSVSSVWCAVGSALCAGDEFCLHGAYDVLSRAAMRAHCEFRAALPGLAAPRVWQRKIDTLLVMRPHPATLVNSGCSAELFAYAGVRLHNLLRCPNGSRRYPLEHLCGAFGWTFADLLLLGFAARDFLHTDDYPLVVLYDCCGFRAPHLLALDVGWRDVCRVLLDHDARYTKLLRLNEAYWQSALTHCGPQAIAST